MNTNEPFPRTRILMVAGGTGGHIFPALAVAEELRKRGENSGAPYRIEFLGTHRPLEAKLIPAAGFPLRTVDAAGLKGIHGMQRIRNLWVLPRTALAVAGILRGYRPQVVVGVGGYLAGPVMLEAAVAGIPTVLIEPNARPGFTNRLLAPFVRIAALGFAETASVYGKKARVTGLPVRRAFFDILPRALAPALLPVGEVAQPGVAVSPFTILAVGGSQGSRAINQAVVKCLPLLVHEAGGGADGGADVGPGFSPELADREVGATSASSGLKPGPTRAGAVRIIHQTGEHDYNEILNAYRQQGLVAEVYAFIDDMPGTLAQADLVISRAGATAVAELAAAGRAALLVPFPGAADQHQLENARAMEKAGAARVVLQSGLTPERLAKEIRELMASPSALDRMETSAHALASPDAAERIADLIENLARSK